FGCGDRGAEWLSKKSCFNGAGCGRPIDEQSDRRARFEATDYLDKCERIFADDEGFDVPFGAGFLTELREISARLGEGNDVKFKAAPGQEGSAEFPVAEMGSEQEDAPFL